MKCHGKDDALRWSQPVEKAQNFLCEDCDVIILECVPCGHMVPTSTNQSSGIKARQLYLGGRTILLNLL